MQQINYIKYLNAAFEKLAEDDRLNPTHIALYVVLFYYWNSSRFKEKFYVFRDELMAMSKIRSKTTYHRCIKDLNNWKYLVYYPSHNKFKGSKVKMLSIPQHYYNNWTSSGQDISSHNTNNCPTSKQELVSNTNINKPNKQNNNKARAPENEKIVIEFFKQENWPIIEGTKFFNYYQSIGWKTASNSKIINWQATARNWMLKARELHANKPAVNTIDNLKINNSKDYNQPL